LSGKGTTRKSNSVQGCIQTSVFITTKRFVVQVSTHVVEDRMHKRKARYSNRRRRVCRTVCTVCGNAYPAGKMTPRKYVGHVARWHTAKVYC
jgi:hypothetical protein